MTLETATMVIEEEKLTPALAKEVLPLLKRQWVEIAHYPDIPLRPDWDAYFNMAESGNLVSITVRVDEKLVGYAVYIMRHNIHYSTSLQAMQDILYVDPEYRRGRLGIKLLQRSEEILEKLGVQVIIQHVKLEHDFSPLLIRMGYEDVEKILCKRID